MSRQSVPHEAIWITAALALGWSLPLVLGLPADGALAATVRFAPALVVALWRLGRSQEAIPVGPLWLASPLWLLVATGATHGDLRFGPQLAIVALLLLISALVWSLRGPVQRAVASSPPERPSAVAFWLPLIVYIAIAPWSTAQRPPDGDEPYYLLVAHSLAWDHDADLSNNYEAQDSLQFMDRALEPQPGDPVGRDGALYSRHNVLLAAALALPYRLAGRPGTQLAMILLSAALAWWSLRLMRRTYPRNDQNQAVMIAWALLVLCPPLLLYSHQIWTEVPAALLVLIAFDAIYFPASDGSRRLWRVLVVILTLPFLKFRFALIAGMLALLAARRGARRRHLLGLGLALLAVTAAIALINISLFGHVLKHYSIADLRLDQRPWISYLKAGFGLFFDNAFGLFACAPLWLLLIPASTLATVRRQVNLQRAAWLFAPYVLLVASRQEWFGGWSPPFRYTLVLLPFLALALVPLFEERPKAGGRLLLAALGAATIVLTIAQVVVPGWTYNIADGGNHLIDRLSLRTGDDLRRFLPSYVRTSTASWLAPLLLSLGSIGLWRMPRRAWRSSLAGGTTFLLLATTALLWGGRALPTHSIEFEDPQVQAHPGSYYPRRWTVDRQNFRGGRWLRPGDTLRAPIIAGGDRLHLDLELSYQGVNAPAGWLLVQGGDQVLERLQIRPEEDWQHFELDDLAWPAGQPLVIIWQPEGVGPENASSEDAEVSTSLAKDVPPAPGQAIILDRAELRWP
ncbi:MAG: hypothetical protein K8J08_21240 [Thermoanaerobaculia bacterium]|nr:hypothetical protein [Thermoanaerobaculia bacterium]